ncbi:hypothetical protein AHF37_10771 [Paragonimus kellicotti]|nr:hypothetical protein AHF37_10771 [Paragonimus kellicotti]
MGMGGADLWNRLIQKFHESVILKMAVKGRFKEKVSRNRCDSKFKLLCFSRCMDE